MPMVAYCMDKTLPKVNSEQEKRTSLFMFGVCVCRVGRPFQKEAVQIRIGKIGGREVPDLRQFNSRS